MTLPNSSAAAPSLRRSAALRCERSRIRDLGAAFRLEALDASHVPGDQR